MKGCVRLRLAGGSPVALAGGRDNTLPLYRVVILRAGEANGIIIPGEVIQRAAGLFEGAPVFADHASALDAGRPGGRSVRDLAGELGAVRWRPESGELQGVLALYPGAGWLAELASAAGAAPWFGLSADLWVERSSEAVRAIRQVNSVDIVINPAAGGRFMAAAPETRHNEEGTMSGMNEGAQAEMLSEPDAEREALAVQVLELKLQAAGLPASLAGIVRDEFAQGSLTAPGLDARIAALQREWSQAVAGAGIKRLGAVQSIVSPVERIELALEALLGLPQTSAHRDAPRLTGIRELYDTLTGDWERRGVFQGERVQLANVTTTTLNFVVANALNKVLAHSYESRPQWWQPIVSEEDFPTMHDVRWTSLGGIGALDTVAEGGDYTEKTWDDAAETAAFSKKGNYIGLTMEMIDRDDVGAVRALPRKLAYAAQRTLSAAVAAVFTANAGVGPTLSDTKALFHADHGNLGAAALSDTAWWAAVQAMFKQGELHSGARQGVRPRYCLVPIELEKTALGIFTSDYPPDAVTWEQNMLRNSASVITVPEFSDAGDWAGAADPADLAGVCIGYRYGRTPEVFAADGELMGAMFTNDELRIKVRFVYAVGVANYRALYKANVA